MIYISKLASGVLVQRDETDIMIADLAVPSTLGVIIASLIDSGKTLANARRESYEAGLLQGHEQGRIEAETRERIADRQASELVEALVGCELASAA